VHTANKRWEREQGLVLVPPLAPAKGFRAEAYFIIPKKRGRNTTGKKPRGLAGLSKRIARAVGR